MFVQNAFHSPNEPFFKFPRDLRIAWQNIFSQIGVGLYFFTLQPGASLMGGGGEGTLTKSF